MYMKKEIHPEVHPVIFRDTGAGVDFVGLSTASSEEKETIDGIEHFVIPVEISSASHPFYTGEENIIDSAGRVEKFKARAKKKATTGKRQRRSRAVEQQDTRNVLTASKDKKQTKSSTKKKTKGAESQQQ